MSEELVVPGIGQVVELDDEVSCIQALVALRDFESQLREAKAALTEAIVERARILGTQTLTMPDGSKASLKGGSEIVYDAQEIEEKLRQLGMPENRIREIVVEQISYSVSAKEAKRAAAANSDYAAVVEGAKTVVEKPRYISVARKTF